jgi:hypothetical protein
VKRAERTPGGCQVQTTYLIIYENEESAMGVEIQCDEPCCAFIEPNAKFILNINLFREIILVKLRVNEVSQCRRSHQRVGHVLKRESVKFKSERD